jgi:hypothetical protein
MADRIVKAILMPFMKGSTGACAPDLADMTLPSKGVMKAPKVATVNAMRLEVVV